MTENEIRALVDTGEADFIERKRLIDLSHNRLQAEFIRDILSLANAHTDGPRFMLVGVNNDGTIEGILAGQYDDARFQQVINNRVEPPIQFSFQEYAFDGKTIGLISIERSSRRPHVVSKQLSDNNTVHLHKGDLWIKRGSSKIAPTAFDYMQFQDAYFRDTKPRPELTVMFANSELTYSPEIKTARKERQDDFDRFYCLPVSIELYVHNTGTAIANRVVVEVTLPEGCTGVPIQGRRDGGWVGTMSNVGTPRPPRFEGERLHHGDFALMGSLSITFPYPSKRSNKASTSDLRWRLLAEELTQPLDGTLTLTPSWF